MSLNRDIWREEYMGKYATNKDLLYMSNGWPIFNLHQRSATKRHPKFLFYGEGSSKKIWPRYLKEGTAASSETWGDTAGIHITSFSYIINPFNADNNVLILNTYHYNYHAGSKTKFAWPKFLQVTFPGH